jgi:hypothetical protein
MNCRSSSRVVGAMRAILVPALDPIDAGLQRFDGVGKGADACRDCHSL